MGTKTWLYSCITMHEVFSRLVESNKDTDAGTDNMEQLLTPKQVANLLQISSRTVYDNKHRLGGFYPAGIKCLRFRKEIIDGILEGSGSKGLGVSVSIPGEKLRGPRIQNQEGSPSCPGGTPKETQITYKTNPSRHGL